MVKKMITEISESDFRKLDLKVKRNERVELNGHVHTYKMKERSINEILDDQLRYMISEGYESDLNDMDIPVTIAIHEDDGYYLDKYMNRFTGAQTYQIGFGIRHLYSTRDYYEAHDDYWRVSKAETKVIYRVKLDDKWKEMFTLKHRTVSDDWPYNELPHDVSPDYTAALLCIEYDLGDDGEWHEHGRYGKFIYEGKSIVIPVDRDGNEIRKTYYD